jgi:hypothetical protein
MLKIQLDKLSKLLQECTIPEKSEEEILVQPVQEEPDKIRNLAEDEPNKKRSLAEDEIPVYTTCRTDKDQKEMPSIEMRLPYPILLLLLPVSILAVSICSIQDEIPKAGILKAGILQISRTESWKAAFLAGSRSGVVGKVNNKVISKVQLERLLRKLLAIYKRDLPLQPTKYSDLEKHLIGHQFEQAELDYLKSYKIINL